MSKLGIFEAMGLVGGQDFSTRTSDQLPSDGAESGVIVVSSRKEESRDEVLDRVAAMLFERARRLYPSGSLRVQVVRRQFLAEWAGTGVPRHLFAHGATFVEALVNLAFVLAEEKGS